MVDRKPPAYPVTMELSRHSRTKPVPKIGSFTFFFVCLYLAVMWLMWIATVTGVVPSPVWPQGAIVFFGPLLAAYADFRLQNLRDRFPTRPYSILIILTMLTVCFAY